MSRRLHLLRATAILSLVVWLQSCLVRRPTLADMPVLVGRHVSVRSAESFQLLPGLPGREIAASTPPRMVNFVEGTIVGVVADTIALERGPNPADVNAASGKGRDLVRFVLTPAAKIAVSPTKALKVTVFAIVVGAVAFLIYLERALNDYEF